MQMLTAVLLASAIAGASPSDLQLDLVCTGSVTTNQTVYGRNSARVDGEFVHGNSYATIPVVVPATVRISIRGEAGTYYGLSGTYPLLGVRAGEQALDLWYEAPGVFRKQKVEITIDRVSGAIRSTGGLSGSCELLRSEDLQRKF